MAVQTQIQTRRGTATTWTSTNPTLAAGEIGFESNTGKIKIGTGSTAWNSLAYTASSTAVTYLFNATAAQTTFSGADANSLTLAYTVGSEQVYLNGVLQVRGSDYTATNGTSIVLTSGATVSDVLNVIAFSALSLSDTYTQAQADAKFFQTANAFLAGKNKIINGDFNINQRGFTSATVLNTYMFDRWLLKATDGTTTATAQTFTTGAAPVAGYEGKNYIQLDSTGQTLTTARSVLTQPIESVRTFAGQTVTVSFWAKASSGTPNISMSYDQYFGTGGSPSAIVSANITKTAITTSWVRYSATVALPSISGKTVGTNGNDFLQILIWTSAGSDYNTVTSSLGIQTTTIQIWGVQVEAGSIATPFQTATGTVQGEIAACQRYFYRTDSAANADLDFGNGTFLSTSLFRTVIPLQVTMRSAPTAVYSAPGTMQITSSTNMTPTGFTLNSAGNKSFCIGVSVASSGTAGYAGILRAASTTSAYFELSAEL